MRRYTPDNVTYLAPNEIFVFGSNAEGRHGKGAALTARKLFGAIYGQASGPQGRSYAIITKRDWRIKGSSTLQEIRTAIVAFLLYALEHPGLTFLVTKLGSSLAGHTVEDMRGIFLALKDDLPDNVILPKEYEVRD